MTTANLLILIAGFFRASVAQECLQGSRLDFTSVSRPATEDLLYVNPQINLQHVIVPELRFNCYGYITSWSALTVIDSSNNLLQFLNYQITFTIWRPRNDGSDSSYDLVGINDLSFSSGDFTQERVISIDNSTGLAPDRFSYFTFQNKAPIKNQNISFQPGDVIGWNVERSQEFLGAGITGPVSVVYRRKTPEDQGSVNVLHVAYENTTRFTRCSVQYCDSISKVESVLPYLTVNYVISSRESASNNDVSTCIDRPDECPIITTGDPTTLSSTCNDATECFNTRSQAAPVPYPARVTVTMLLVIMSIV